MSDVSPVLDLFKSIGSGFKTLVYGLGYGAKAIVEMLTDLEALYNMLKGCGYLITFIGIVLCGLFTWGACWVALLLAFLGVEGLKDIGGSKTRRIKHRRKKRTSKKLT